ncbi:MAG: hypothetical protein IPK37_08595 [Austwickia sp.]|jgi:hypothetical protein|nr:MAG: hypothetical protein IPK37_08595 [Austwickia sp.]
MDTHSAMIGPRSAASALQAVRDAETLAAYIGTCPTCLGWDDPEATSNERTPEPGRAVCPTCGLCSVEWDLAVAIQAELDRITRLDRLDAAVQAVDEAPARTVALPE